MLHRIDGIDADIAAVDAQIEAYLAPFASAAARLDEIPGIGPVAAAVILAEIGADMARFPPQGTCVRGRSSHRGSTPRRVRPRATDPPVTVTATWPGSWARPPWWPAGPNLPGRTLPAHRPTARQERAVVAVGRSILVIAWHLLADQDTHFTDLGADHFTKHTNPGQKRNRIRQLEALGYTVTLTQQPDQTVPSQLTAIFGLEERYLVTVGAQPTRGFPLPTGDWTAKSQPPLRRATSDLRQTPHATTGAADRGFNSERPAGPRPRN